MGFITKQGLQALTQYKYHSGVNTKLDRFLNPFWEWLEHFIPLNIAPNLVTFVGFLLVMSSYLIMIFYDQTFKKFLPPWVYITAGILQWAYQTLDALDGKHARRTKSSSPLGQLFDHGCDSFAASFLALSVCQSLRFGPTWEILFFFNLVQFCFFAANWGEYHTGIMNTGWGNIGVTEGQFTMGLSLALCGIIGPDFYDITFEQLIRKAGTNPKMLIIPGWMLRYSLKQAVMGVVYVGLVVVAVYYYFSTIILIKDKVYATLQFVPVFANMITTALWSTLPIFQDHAALIMLISGVIFSLNTSRVIVCSLTKMKSPIIQQEYIVYFVGYLIARLMFGPEWRKIDVLVLALLIAYVSVASIVWASGCIEQIASYLGIYCLSLKKRQKKLKE